VLLLQTKTGSHVENLPNIGVLKNDKPIARPTDQSLLGLDISIKYKIYFSVIEDREYIILEK
jgi:hypothetical protein